ncbi:MAG: HAMP domain-containing histidine kinase [Cytophagales bacterium]|nr:HAMP domain-containing histidine kinase [Cytophagales bacterium]
MKFNRLHFYLVGGALLIGLFLVFQMIWSVSVYQSEEKAYRQGLWEALYEVTDRLADSANYDTPSREPVSLVRDGYYHVELNQPVDLDGLAILLRESLKKKGLDVRFELGVFECEKAQQASVAKYTPGEGVTKEDLSDFFEDAPHDFVYFFGAKFPDAQVFLWRKAYKWALPLLGFFLILLMFVWIAWVVLKRNRLFEMQRDFINNMAHEFKTPIASIGIVAEAFSKVACLREDERMKKYLRILNKQNRHLNKQVDRVLQIATIEKQELPLEWELLNVSEVVREALECFEEPLRQRGGKFVLDIPEGIGVRADKTHFLNMIHNLLDNAVKYSQRELLLHVYVQNDEGSGKTALVVEDNGIGISKNHLKFIFDKFYRVPTGNTHNVKGFGLGLYYVYKIAKAFGWEVRIGSELAEGTTVALIFPEVVNALETSEVH